MMNQYIFGTFVHVDMVALRAKLVPAHRAALRCSTCVSVPRWRVQVDSGIVKERGGGHDSQRRIPSSLVE